MIINAKIKNSLSQKHFIYSYTYFVCIYECVYIIHTKYMYIVLYTYIKVWRQIKLTVNKEVTILTRIW